MPAYTITDLHGTVTHCQSGPVDNWLLMMLATGRLSEQEINDLRTTYHGDITAWIAGDSLFIASVRADDIINVTRSCAGVAGYPVAPTKPPVWQAGFGTDQTINSVLPIPAGFVRIATYTLRDLNSVDPNVDVRFSDTELVVPPDTIRADKLRAATTKMAADAQAHGSTILGVSWLKRRDRRVVSRSWQPPSIITSNPVYRFFGLPETYHVPFGGDALQDVDVWRVRVVEDLGPLAIVAIVLIVALIGVLAVTFYQTRSVNSVVKKLHQIINSTCCASGSFLYPLTPGGVIATSTPPLLIFVAAGGLVTLGLMLIAQKSGLNVGTYQPPSLPQPTTRVGLRAGPVTTETGFSGGSSGGSGGGGGQRRAPGRR